MATYDKLVTLFSAAVANGVHHPKMTLGDYKISVAQKFLPSEIVLYIKDKNNIYTGKIVNGEFIKATWMHEIIESDMKETLSDPLDAAIKHGRKTGNCCVCGRVLTNKHSIKMMIGPICAEKYGFGLFGSLLLEDEDSDSNDIKLEDI